MEGRKSRAAVVLLVEDDSGDQELTRRALMSDVHRVDLRVVNDGEQALDYLYRRGAYSDLRSAPPPDLMLLDLNMPKLDGREVLKTIKDDPRFRLMPVVVLTTSQQETDILRSYDLGCNAFVTKPVDIDNFIDAIRRLQSYWFDLVTLPGMRPTDARTNRN